MKFTKVVILVLLTLSMVYSIINGQAGNIVKKIIDLNDDEIGFPSLLSFPT